MAVTPRESIRQPVTTMVGRTILLKTTTAIQSTWHFSTRQGGDSERSATISEVWNHNGLYVTRKMAREYRNLHVVYKGMSIAPIVRCPDNSSGMDDSAKQWHA